MIGGATCFYGSCQIPKAEPGSTRSPDGAGSQAAEDEYRDSGRRDPRAGEIRRTPPRTTTRSVVESGRIYTHKKKVRPFDLTLKRRLPTLPRDNRSTIGVSELNFSVRNGKRWNLTAITT